MRRFLTIPIILITLTLTASIVKSNIGAVNESFLDGHADGISAKSYVKNGLLSLWDGIENVGYGLHDDTAVVWKDLTGHGYDLTVNSGSFGDFSFDATGTHYASRVGGIEFASIEAVVVPVSLNRYMKNIFISGSGGNYGRVIGGYATWWSCTAFETTSSKYGYDIINGNIYCVYADNIIAQYNTPILVNNVLVGNPESSALDGGSETIPLPPIRGLDMCCASGFIAES